MEIVTPHWLTARGEFIRPGERCLLYAMAAETATRFESPTIVNIGVSWGASVNCLRAGAPDARLVAIDIDLSWRRVHSPGPLHNVEFIEADSSKYGLKFSDPVHLLFIDGGHEYGAVRGDIEAWIPHIPIGGMAIFHDYAPIPRDRERLAGVARAVDEWHEANSVSWRPVVGVDSTIVYVRVK